MSDQILTDAELEAIAELNEARTQGEWTAQGPDPIEGDYSIRDVERKIIAEAFSRVGSSNYRPAEVNAAFIAACSTAVPKMLETIRQQRELLKDAVSEGYARHAEGCSGGIRTSPRGSDGEYPYPCKCGYIDWLEKARD